GALWQPVKQISLGATFRSATAITMSGHTEEEDWPLVKTMQEPRAQAGFAFPLVATVGISYRPTEKWNLEFDADYTDWGCLGTVTIHQSKPPPPFLPNTDLAFDWQPSWMYEFGVTRYFDGGWHVSGGYVYSENSVPNAYYTPLVADMARHFFSVGAGRDGKRFDFDVAGQLGYGPTHTVTGSKAPSLSGQFTGETADGKYHFMSYGLLVTAGMHF
ncbi:MAG: outer membrane protein transport protein, partial [Verrucomicrobia bacterium]|nr:outer membrane protein transport protein [Verrucomicrobiota bacterium]